MQIIILKCTCEDSSQCGLASKKYFKVNQTAMVETLPTTCVHKIFDNLFTFRGIFY